MELPDQKVWEVTKLLYNEFQHDEQSRKLDVDNLSEFKKLYVKPLYPHREDAKGDITRISCCEACCEVNPGYFACCKAIKPGEEFRKLGLGMCLYFKFLKHACCVLLVVAFISLISCLICFLVGAENQFSPTQTYNNFFFSSTMGTFSSQRSKCEYSLINSVTNMATFELVCPYGEVSAYGVVFSKESDNTLYNCRSEIKKYQNADSTYSTSSYIVSGNTLSCNSKKNTCTVNPVFNPIRPSFTTVAYSFQCVNQVYQLKGVTAKSEYLLYSVVGIDLLCCVIIALFYCSEVKAEQDQVQYFKCQQLSLCDFALKIHGFNIGTFDDEFNNFVKASANMLGNDFPQQFVQVKTPDSQDFIDYQKKKEEAYMNLYEVIDYAFFDKEVNPNQYKTTEDFISRNFAEGQYEKYREKIVKAVNQFALVEYRSNPERENKTVSIFLVLNTRKAKKRLYELQQEGCFSRYFPLNEKQYHFMQPPAPDLILWKNKGKWTWFRLIISWILTLCICFGSYMLFGYIQFKENELLSSYNFSIDCTVLYATANLNIFDSTLSAQSGNYLSCFCQKNLLNFDNADYSRCTEWRYQYVTYLAIPAVISLLLVVYNVVVSFIFRHLTNFECHRLITDQLISFTVKRSFLLIMNMGLIMILLNMKFSDGIGITQVGFLFQGKYTDLTADWYINIGSIIIMTMIFNIAFPIIQLFLANIVKCFKRCWDKKCCCRKTSCRTKSEYMKLFSDDIYPIEERYAFLISVILITLAFSCIIPLLNVICAISIMLLYFSDKILVFKVYQTPLNYNEQLHKLINKAIYLGLIAHMALSAFFLSEQNLLAANSMIPQNTRLNSGNTRINYIITTSYIIPYVILFLLLSGWSFFSNTFIALFQKCISVCSKNLSNIEKKYAPEDYFFDCLTPFQMNRLKMLTESEINKLAAKKSSFPTNTSAHSATAFEDTMKPMFGSRVMSQHQALLRRTFMKLKAEQSLRRRSEGGVKLIGQPGYELMLNDEAFEQNRKNIVLSEALNFCLRDYLINIRNEKI